MQRHLLVIAAFALATAPGCDVIKSMRAFFHPSEGQAPDFGSAGLRVEVDPPDGISILIDDRRVATVSPYVSRQLKAGPHRLEIRALGYHSVILPVVLEEDELLTVPISLRRRRHADANGPDAREPAPEALAAPEPPAAPAPVLPVGVDPISLQVTARPPVPVMLDKAPVEGRTVHLERVHGEITVGVTTLAFRIGGSGLLVLTVADDGATWSRDGKRLKPGATFRLHRGSTRLRRIAADGTDQTVLLRR